MKNSAKLFRQVFVSALFLFLIFSCNFVYGENAASSKAKGFSFQLPSDWIELQMPFQGDVVSYGKKGTLATFHVSRRDAEAAKTIDQMKWEDLFSPQFASIDIRTQGATTLGGEKAKYCLYVLKPGDFKTTMEGALPAKYMNYVVVHGGKLYSITFKDTMDGFVSSYASFLTILRTLRFDTADPQSTALARGPS